MSPDIDAQAAPATDYEVKAAFLYHFAKFVTWPPEVFPEPTSSIVIGILGDDPLGAVIEDAIANKLIDGRPLVVARFKKVQEIARCQILFIGSSEKAHLRETLEALQPLRVLTVSDMDRFLESGGMISFITEKNKVRFSVNLEPAIAASLKISSRLLKVARPFRAPSEGEQS